MKTPRASRSKSRSGASAAIFRTTAVASSTWRAARACAACAGSTALAWPAGGRSVPAHARPAPRQAHPVSSQRAATTIHCVRNPCIPASPTTLHRSVYGVAAGANRAPIERARINRIDEELRRAEAVAVSGDAPHGFAHDQRQRRHVDREGLVRNHVEDALAQAAAHFKQGLAHGRQGRRGGGGTVQV